MRIKQLTEQELRTLKSKEKEWIESINFLKNFPENTGKYKIIYDENCVGKIKKYIVESVNYLGEDLFIFNNNILIMDVEILSVFKTNSKKASNSGLE